MASSLRDQVNGLLNEYSELVHKFFQSLTSLAENTTIDEATGQAPMLLAERIIEVDDRLQVALDQIEEHQTRQQRIIRVQDDIQQRQVAMLEIIKRLYAARENLDSELTKANKELTATRYAKQSNVQFTDILSYASKLSKYTSAPPNFEMMSRDVKIDFEKPYPDEERMRRGILYLMDADGQPPSQDDKHEHFESDSSGDEGAALPKDNSLSKPTEDGQANPFWILDLNPDLAS